MELPKGGILGKTWTVFRKVSDMGIPGHAANAGYFIVLSVFPMLVLLLSALRYTSLDAGDLMAFVAGFLPDALLPMAERLIISTYAHTSTAMVSVSVIGVLWSASRGIYGVLKGLNSIYGVKEDRGYLYTRSISVLYTFLFLLVMMLTLLLNIFGEYILDLFPKPHHKLWKIISSVIDFRFFLLLALQTALFTAVFMVLPNRRNSFSDSIPGALLASTGWLVFTELFSVYVDHFQRYSSIYGSVYAVALAMIWLYCCISILFYGGALNRLLMDSKKEENVTKM